MKRFVQAASRSSFKKINGYRFTKDLIAKLQRVIPQNSPRDASNHYGYAIELENVPTTKKLIRITTGCLDSMGYSVFFGVDDILDLPDDGSFYLAAVDDATKAWAKLCISWFPAEKDGLITIDFDNGNALAEDWYEED